MSETRLRYRPEIDGLRALAVIPVILYHAKFKTFGGGFAGVDVFFVISGYLITSLIYREIREGTFSIIHFYERRIRRILPALFVVILASLPFAGAWMLPAEFKEFSKSIVAINIFASNVLFWKESGYFAESADLKPLLHTWSLSVEEQFYVFFPLFLLLFRRLRQWWMFALIVAFVGLSLGSAEWASRLHPNANFYLLPTRAWELGVGSILAISANVWLRVEGPLAQAGSAIGLAMILYTFLVIDRFVPFPSLWALIPVGGTALVIACARPTTIVGRLLSMRPVVGLGLISYSAYLWHLPLFIFARIRIYSEPVSPAIYLALSVLSLFLAYLSWRFVEQPCRSKTKFSRAQVFSASGAATAAIIVFGLAGYFTSGFPNRNENFSPNMEQRLARNVGLSPRCSQGFTLSPKCRTDDNPEIVVWGDSFAMHLLDGIIASNEGVKIIQMTKPNCGPILEISPFRPPTYPKIWAKECIEFNETVRDYISNSKSVKYVVLASLYRQYLSRIYSKVLIDGVVTESDIDLIERYSLDTLDWIAAQGIKPVVFAPTPIKGRNDGLCSARNAWLGTESAKCNAKSSEFKSIRPDVFALLKSIETRYQVVWPTDFLCDEIDCMTTKNGIFIYGDRSHYSREGSRYVGKTMDFYGLITGSK